MLFYYFLAALIQVVWSLTPSASQVVLRTLPVEGYSAIRYTVSGLIFLFYSLMRGGRIRIHKGDLPKLALLGIFTYGIDSLGTLYALKLGGVLNFGLASSLNSIITASVAILILQEKVSRYFIYAAFLSLIGSLVLLWGKYDLSSFHIAAGSLILVWGAYVFEALGFVFSKKYKPKYALSEYLAILQLSAAIFMWVLCILGHRLPVQIFELPPIGWISLCFVCLFSCCLCYLILYWLLNHIDGHKLAFFDCFHSISAAFLGFLFFGDPFNAKMLLGGAILFSAVVLITQIPRKKSA